MDQVFVTHQASMRGTKLHELAKMAIELRTPFPNTNKTIDRYVNDGIGFRMRPEQILAYSENAFGTADTLSFREGKLRIHDLKTGTTKTSMKQLWVYVALFCLEYQVRPSEIEIELRIYQNDDIYIEIPSLEDIVHVMDRIVTFDKRIKALKEEARS